MNNFETKQIKELVLLGVALLIPLLILIYISINNKQEIKHDTEQEETAGEELLFEDVEVIAKSALVTELQTGKVLFSKDHTSKQPIASITKLFTSIIASEKIGKSGTEYVKIKEDYLTPVGDWGFVIGDDWKLKDLIDFTLLTSSNDGARALALSAFENDNNKKFISEMNSFSRKIGLDDTHFLNETGLDINYDSEAGASSSAHDITKLLRYATFTNPGLFDGTSRDHSSFYVGGKVYNSENTNKIVNEIPGLLLSKTGYTDIAGGNLVIVADIGLNNPVSVVVLGSTKEGRFEDVLKLYNEALNFYANQ